MKKIKYLIDHYKETKDWNSKHTGGNLQKSVFYDESDEVPGCQGIVTRKNLVHDGTVRAKDTESKVGHLTNSNTTKSSSERDEQAKSQITRPGLTKTKRNKKRKTRKKRNKLQCLLLGS